MHGGKYNDDPGKVINCAKLGNVEQQNVEPGILNDGLESHEVANIKHSNLGQHMKTNNVSTICF